MSDTDTVDIEIENDESDMADDIDAEGVDPGVAADVEEEEDAEEFERERAVAFEEATDTLAETFAIDARSGETITELATTETEDGRQLVATVDRRRRTAIAARQAPPPRPAPPHARLADARRAGRRLGVVALVLGVVALALSALRSRGDDAEGLDVSDLDDEI
jgi:hypothetical protein